MCRTGTLSLQARKKKKKTWTPVSLCVRRWRRRKARETKQTKKQKAKIFEKEMFRNLAHIELPIRACLGLSTKWQSIES